MLLRPRDWLVLLLTITLLAISARNSQARITVENGLKSAVYLSREWTLQPGSVANKFYYDIDFPKGHIAIKSFDAEVVDEAGNPVPLHETYLHHWVAVRYYQRQGVKVPKYNANLGFHQSDFIIAGNSGVCKRGLSQFFGLGSETRKTSTHVPDPYGIEAGNPAEIPDGYEEKWMFNIHAIDTRDTEDKLGCTECRCSLYNVTIDEYGRPLKPNYEGGLYCCYDETQCRTKHGVGNVKRNLYMRYTVKWVDWDNSIVPVKIYIFDVTDTWKKSDGLATKHDCKIEYNVESCPAGVNSDQCVDTRRVTLSAPTSGDIIYGVGHQHTGGIGTSLYGEGGRLLCSSVPVYGDGNEAGNEAGYIVGMSTCYPRPGSLKISSGETIVVESNYSSAQRHTGVMGLFYILVAEPSSGLDVLLNASAEMQKKSTIPNHAWGLAIFAVGIAAAVVVVYRVRSQKEDGYQSI